MTLPSEFALIARHFRPLAGPGALDLGDDAALLDVPVGRQLALAADAMVTRFESLSPSSTVSDAAECLIRTTQHEFPVVDGGGKLRGVLTRDAMVQALRDRGPDAPVLDAMQANIPLVHHRQPLSEALRVMQEGGTAPAVGVVDGTGRLIGYITSEAVGEMMMLHALMPQGRRARPPNPWGQGG